MDAAHQTAALAVQVGVDFLFKSGLVQVTAADGYAESDGLLFGLAGDVLVDGDGGVDASAFAEEGADGPTGSFWCDEDDVDVCRYVDFCKVLENGREAVGEVEGLLIITQLYV